jgi:four helix bundle protein
MGFAENFEDLQIWQRSRGLTNQIYDAFSKCRDLDFRSQIQRASVSVMNYSSGMSVRLVEKKLIY